MRKFAKGELITVITTLFFITVITAVNMVAALRRARDAHRKVDIGIISNALNDFQADYGFFPKSENGKVVICKNENFEEVRNELAQLGKMDFDVLYRGLVPCTWGVDVFEDVFSDNGKPYMTTFPSDPKRDEGYSYYYISNGSRYQIFSYLEGEEDEVGYDSGIVKRNLPCGVGVCSFGKSYGATPLDVSIEEYEEELLKI